MSFLSMILILLLLLFIIILWGIVYLEIHRYWSMHYKTWKNLHNLDQKYHIKKRVNIAGKVVVSLTTIPDRINKLAPTLCSIMTQSKRVDEIRINLPYCAY